MENNLSGVDKGIFKLISVESRKGGVGKTTVALNLAKVFLRRNFSVLFIDCDIIGTSISGAIQSDYYKDDFTELLDGAGNPINILEYYQKHYLKGDDDIVSKLDIKFEKKDKKRVYILQSDLFDSKHELIVNPTLLLDEIHSYWFVKMLKSICTSFATRVDPKCAVILDNSPGYLSLNAAIHKWMTEIGPKDAKYLLVSSIDKQDLESNLDSATEIKETVDLKNKVLNYYYAMHQAKVGGPAVKDEDDVLSNKRAKEMLYQLIDKNESVEQVPELEVRVTSYLNLIFNKVPEDCQENLVDRLGQEVSQQKAEMLNLIAKNEDGRDNFLLFEESLSRQYYTQFYANTLKSKIDITYWKPRISRLNSQNESLRQSDMDMVEKVREIGKLYVSLSNSLTNRAPKSIAATYDPEWTPVIALDSYSEFFPSLQKVSRNYFQLNQGGSLERLYSTYYFRLWDLISSNKISEYLSLLLSFFEYTNKCSNFHQKDDKGNETIILGPIFFMYFVESLMSRLPNFKSFPELLRSDINNETTVSVTIEDLMKLSQGYIHIRKSGVFVEVLGSIYASFYKLLCVTLLKTIEMHSDFDLVMTWIEGLMTNPNLKLIAKGIQQYLSEVIVDKKEEGEKTRLLFMMNKAGKIAEVENALRIIVHNDWSMGNL
jgi:hypothetical protein